jgi:hypothetical protein
MGKLLLRLLVVVGLLSSLAYSPALAATISLEVGPSGDLVVHNQTSLDVGGVYILTIGAPAFAFNVALPELSFSNSVFADAGIPPYAALIATNNTYGVALVPAGSQALLGTFQIPSLNDFGIFSGDDLLGGTVTDAFGNVLVPASVDSYAERLVCGETPCVPQVRRYFFVMTFVPEPAGAGLASLPVLGLAALVSTRRITSCA